jgi:hypothetical protein
LTVAEEPRIGDRCIEVHQAMIYDRGGDKRLWQLVDVAQVQWTRKLSAYGTADLTITGEACRDQADVLGKIEPRRHELVLFRNGNRVWEGPIVQVGWFRDKATLLAHDCLEYLRYTPLTKTWPNSDDGGPSLMTERIQQILDYELVTPYTMTTGTAGATKTVTVPRWERVTPPINILPFLDVRPGAVLTRSHTDPFEMTVYEHLKNLARSGLDFTMVGRQLVVWDSAQAIGRTRTLTDNDFAGNIEVFAAGSDHYSIAHVVAQAQADPDDPNPPDDLPPVVGNAGDQNPFYGVWTQIVTTENEEGASTPTQDELNGQAARALLGRTPVPLEIRVPSGASLIPSFDLTIPDLVPGVEVPVLATLNLRQVSQLQRLKELKVSEGSTQESVSVSLEPAGDVVGTPLENDL